MSNQRVFLGLVLCLCLLVSSCVTSTNVRPINKDLAHDKRVDLGIKYLDIGMRDNARRQFSMALELKPKSALAYHGIARVHLANGEIEPAKMAFEKSLKAVLEKDRTTVQVSYGKYLLEHGDPERACQYFEQATQDYDYGGRVNALYLAGKCALKRGDLVRVKAAYEHVVNLNSSFVPVLIELADIYFNEGEYAKCRALLNNYEKAAEPNAQSLWLAIRLEKIFGNKDKASSYALSLKNRFPYSNEYLAYKKLLKQK